MCIVCPERHTLRAHAESGLGGRKSREQKSGKGSWG